jgi:hypothetical protein
MFKPSSYTSNWIVMDTARDPSNVADKWLYPDGAFQEESGSTRSIDILSNGFKIRIAGTGLNQSSGTIIYACFASSPFSIALAR